VTKISATSLPSSISQLGNVGNSRASKLLAIVTPIKFQSVDSVVTMSEFQKLRPLVLLIVFKTVRESKKKKVKVLSQRVLR
jgi:hypothetical protein